jgi:DEAD/DEAH box helicase domain-containing protein
VTDFINFRCREHRQDYQDLLQVAELSAGGLAARPLGGLYRRGGLRPGGWVAEERALPIGLHCRICLEAGVLDGIPDYDQRDLEDAGLGDTPHLGLSAADFDVDAVWSRMQARYSDLVVTSVERPARPESTDSSLRNHPKLHRDVATALYERVLSGRELWSHQSAAISAALDGKDVVVETATASGKSLCYWVPVLSELRRDPTATALYLAPLNALVEDQLEAVTRFSSMILDPRPRPQSFEAYCRKIRLGVGDVVVARYDGQVPNDYRKPVRAAKPRVLITNPEMLNQGILPHHELWSDFFSGLRFIVLDEMHVYRGMFGANVANLLRRVMRIAHHKKRRPRVIGCSASIGNPAELFAALTGRTAPIVVSAAESGAPVYRQRMVLLDSARSGEAMPTTAKNIILDLVGGEHARTITFMRSISEVDQVYGYVSGELQRAKGVGERTIREYKREIPVAEKAQITRDLRTGATLGVISTTALQLGIDIGDLSAALVCKFPGSKAALMQQAGRVGRQGESLAILLLDESPFDQHFVLRPDDLLQRGSEVVYLNPDHPEVLGRHLLAAAEELPLDPAEDRRFFGAAITDALARLASEGQLDRSAGADVLILNSRYSDAAQRIEIRALGFNCVIRDESGAEVASPDVTRAMQRFHKYARFRVQDRAYEVTRLTINWSTRKAEGTARLLDRLDFTTTPKIETDCELLGLDEEGSGPGPAALRRGPVLFHISVPAYYRIPASQLAQPEFQALGAAEPPPRETRTEGTWFEAPIGWLDDLDVEDRLPAVRSAAEALRTSAALLCSTDPADVGLHTDVEVPGLAFRIVLSDIEAGGNGLTRQVFGQPADLLSGALAILEDCPHCSTEPESRGCPRCVTTHWGDERDVFRLGGIELLQRLDSQLR